MWKEIDQYLCNIILIQHVLLQVFNTLCEEVFNYFVFCVLTLICSSGICSNAAISLFVVVNIIIIILYLFSPYIQWFKAFLFHWLQWINIVYPRIQLIIVLLSTNLLASNVDWPRRSRVLYFMYVLRPLFLQLIRFHILATWLICKVPAVLQWQPRFPDFCHALIIFCHMRMVNGLEGMQMWFTTSFQRK